MKYIIIGILLFSVSTVTAQTNGSLSEEASDILSDPCFSSANISLLVRDLTTGADLVEHRSYAALPPASTLKVWTTAAALDQLGADFRFKTRIYIDGEMRGDTLFGDLIIKGYGDPSLASAHLGDVNLDDIMDQLVAMIGDAGIVNIQGGIIADASFISLDHLPRTWPYQDMGNYYGSYYCGLNVHDNLFYLDFKQESRQGDLVSVSRVRPHVPDLFLECLVRSGSMGSGDQAYIMGSPLQNNRLVIGTIPPGSGTFTIKGSLPDPALFLAHHLDLRLQHAGIEVTKGYRSNYVAEISPGGTILGELESPTLLEIVDETNKKSVNLFAEGLGRYLEKVTDSDSEFLLDYWEERGANLEGCRLSDFAGLAPDNAITAQAMVEVLSIIERDSLMGGHLKGSLAVGGVSGTLQYMWRDSPARGNIIAKSGLISGVRSYAGYINTRSGRTLVFCVLTQNAGCSSQVVRWKLEQLLETVYLSAS